MESIFQKFDKSDNKILSMILEQLSKINPEGFNQKETSFSQRDGEFKLHLVSKNNKSLPLTFLVYKNIFNSYIGHFQIHKIDDIVIKNIKGYLQLKKEVEKLLYSKITEKLFIKDNKLKEYEYTFFFENKTRIYNSSFFFHSKNYNVENHYEPWVEK